jgi:predicted aspartyl protease
MTDPLPVAKVRVNGSEPVNSLIDTGGAELIIDTKFAQETGAAQFGSVTGTFAGGQKAGVQHGRVDSLRAGDFTIRNVPVHIMDVRRFSPIFGGTRVDGIIGTVLLYHFIATLDYPEGRLTLRLKTEQNLKQIEQEAVKQGSIVVPFWMAGDHCMVAWGTVNNSPPMLFFVDTGLAGRGFVCPESTLQKAGIKLQEDQAEEG